MIRAAAIVVAVSALATTYAAPAMAGPYDQMISTHASANGVPEALVRRVIVRESRYRPEVISKGNYGMMQIKLPTARSMGYSGDARGLLDANTNLTYAVKYLAGAYRAAHGNHDLAVRYYAGGYYYAAKRQGWNANAIASSAPTASLTSTPVASVIAAHDAPSGLSIEPPGAAKPITAANATRTGAVGDPFAFTIKDQKHTRVAQADSANPLANLFAPQPKKSRRALRAERALRAAE